VDADELHAARENFAQRVEEVRAETGDESPFAAYLNVMTDALLEANDRIGKLEGRVKSLEDWVERKQRRY